MPFLKLKQQLAESISHFLAQSLGVSGVPSAQILMDLNTPPQSHLGHVALPCFKFSKQLRKPSDQIAKDLAAQFSKGNITAVATGPYVNFRWNLVELSQTTLSEIFSQKEKYGSDSSGKQQRIVLEYCSPNIAKKLGFQHIRSTLIGNVLANVYEQLGYATERINFVGDWGTQFARLLAAVELWGDRTLLKDAQGALSGSPQNTLAMDHLFELYVRFHKEVEQKPEYLTLASECLQRLESNEGAAKELWENIRSISFQAVDSTLAKMNVRFHHVEGESKYIDGAQETLEEVKHKAQAKLSEGAWIVEVEGISTPALIQKKDGTTLYLTRDLAAAVDRFQRFDFQKMIYVVSEQQKLHFQLLFGVLKKMGHAWADRCEHVSFGTVLFGSEKMSTREGKVIFLDELLLQAKEKALEECTQKNPDLMNKESVAEMVGVGALIFGNLSTHRKTDLEFKWENVIALDGETGPYVQYSLVRCTSLLEKAFTKGETIKDIDLTAYEFAPEEDQLVLTLAQFRSTLHSVTRENEPYLLTHYLIDLAKAFNRFYYKLPVLQSADSSQRQFRLNLVMATAQTLRNGLTLLGIGCPKEM